MCNPVSKEFSSDSVELCETAVWFCHIQTIGTNVRLPKMHNINDSVPSLTTESILISTLTMSCILVAFTSKAGPNLVLTPTDALDGSRVISRMSIFSDIHLIYRTFFDRVRTWSWRTALPRQSSQILHPRTLATLAASGRFAISSSRLRAESPRAHRSQVLCLVRYEMRSWRTNWNRGSALKSVSCTCWLLHQ